MAVFSLITSVGAARFNVDTANAMEAANGGPVAEEQADGGQGPNAPADARPETPGGGERRDRGFSFHFEPLRRMAYVEVYSEAGAQQVVHFLRHVTVPHSQSILLSLGTDPDDAVLSESSAADIWRITVLWGGVYRLPLPQPDANPNVADNEDADSALGEERASDTTSISSSILEYKRIGDRTYHSDKWGRNYGLPNDKESGECMDRWHHVLSQLLDGKLCSAPIENPQYVLDVGTGTGIWAIDFADEYPSAEVIGTDLSPMMPDDVPPNAKFELEDCTQPWSFLDDTFDFVHMRLLVGGITDWTAFFREAYRSCKPGGWAESAEVDPRFCRRDGKEVDGAAKSWNLLFEAGGPNTKYSFILGDKQKVGMKAAGFEEIDVAYSMLPVGDWPADPKYKEIGRDLRLALYNYLSGYTLYLWTEVLRWDLVTHELFLMGVRKLLRSNDALYLHCWRVWGRKPVR